MLYHCSIRKARLTEMGCAGVHEISVKTVSRDRSRYDASPVTIADRQCAVCPGVLVRLGMGLEPQPVPLPSYGTRCMASVPPRHKSYSRIREQVASGPIPAGSCPSCSKPLGGRNRIYCGKRCKDAAYRVRLRESRVERVPTRYRVLCAHCGTEAEKANPAKYCSRRCKELAHLKRAR